jgi:MIP family channel proteins
MFVFVLGGGVVAGTILNKTKASGSGWIVITLGWGFAVAFPVYAVSSISGAHLNPAVTLGLAVVGDFPWEQVPTYVAAQLLGAFLGATFVWVYYLPHWKETPDAGTKLAVFATGPAVRKTWSNLVSEMLGTAVLLFGLQVLGANRFGEGLNPLIVGFLIVSIGLSLGPPRATPSTRPATWVRGWPTQCCPSSARVPPTGLRLDSGGGPVPWRRAGGVGVQSPVHRYGQPAALGIRRPGPGHRGVAVFTENRSRPEGPGQPEKN